MCETTDLIGSFPHVDSHIQGVKVPEKVDDAVLLSIT